MSIRDILIHTLSTSGPIYSHYARNAMLENIEVMKGITPYPHNPYNHKNNCRVWKRDAEARAIRIEKNRGERYECKVQDIELSPKHRSMS